MIRGLRRRITYANVVSTLALVLALGGGAVYAAGRAGPKEIKKGAIRSYHVKNRQIRRQDIAGGSINSDKVSNQTLKGRDLAERTLTAKNVAEDTLTGRTILESSLGLVPTAQEARAISGITARVVRFSQPEPSGPASVVVQGGLTAALSCDAGVATLQLSGSAAEDNGTVFDAQSGNRQIFDSATPQTVDTGNATPGFATVRRGDGTVTRLEFELRWGPGAFGGSDVCHLHGFLLSGK